MSETLEACIDLAAERLGGRVLAVNDEFFASKDNLLKADAPVFLPHEYTDRGKWMDGWETRRRREPGFDWGIVRLGIPGVIQRAVVDTAHFKGNYPEACSLEGLDAPLMSSASSLQAAVWQTLVERTLLKGDTPNALLPSLAPRVSHVRLNIFPDGGVARLRLLGRPEPDWSALAQRGEVDLALALHGGVAQHCSDMFFSDANHLLLPDAPRNMGDGWETKRRRGPGHDWVIVRLGHAGRIVRFEVDTTHFKGNAPDRCAVDVCDAAEPSNEGAYWHTVIEAKLQPNLAHELVLPQPSEPASHVRLRIFPDGGVARLRVWGHVA